MQNWEIILKKWRIFKVHCHVYKKLRPFISKYIPKMIRELLRLGGE